MQTHNLVQGSQEWHEFRAKHFGASEAAAMLGLSKQLSRNDLLLYKKTGKSKEYSEWMQANILDYGHEVEAMARELLESEIGDELYPVTCSDGMMLSASCDGLTIDGHVAFEHKQFNADLAHFIIANNTLPDTHMPQCQQILLVTGAQKVIFVCSDGTENNRVKIEILPDQSWFDRISTGWSQFAKDLQDFAPREIAEKPEPAAIMQLPALSIRTEGKIAVFGNLSQFKDAADDFIESVNTDLKTDEDFANAEETIKKCKEVEQNVKAAKAMIIGGISSVDEATRTLDYTDQVFSKMRLTLEKLVKTQKESIKTKIIDDAYKLCAQHQSSIAEEFQRLNFAALANLSRQSFETACKNKRTLASLHNAVDTEVAAIKIRLDDLARVIRKNIAHLPEDLSLFRDLQSIITKPEDDFKLLVESRMAEQKRKEEEAAQRAIAEAKAREDAAAKRQAEAQERERIAALNAAQKTPEPIAQPEPQKPQKPQIDQQKIRTVLIECDRLSELLRKESIYDALIAAGVDSWEGYDVAIENSAAA